LFRCLAPSAAYGNTYIYIYTYMYRNICVCLQVVCSTVCRTKAIKVSHRSCEETLGTIHGHTLRNAIWKYNRPILIGGTSLLK
jgi:hypothetical protein